MRVIDLHVHILPGLDDGPRWLDESLELARAAVADGTHTLAATPHVRSDWPTAPEEMEHAVESLRAQLAAAEIPLTLLTGGEIAFDALPELDEATLKRFGLGGNPRWLLLETPYSGWPLGLDDAIAELASHGFAVVLAHPERNGDIAARPERLRPLVDAGMLVQLTAASLDGRAGPHARRTAFRLLDLELAHVVATDAHAPAIRETGIEGARRALDDDALFDWLTEQVPAAVVAGEPIPARPPRPTRRLGFAGFGR